MTSIYKQCQVGFLLILCLIFLTGCPRKLVRDVEPSPSTESYEFISFLPEFREQWAKIYPRDDRVRGAVQLSAFLGEPEGYHVCFSKYDIPWLINNPEKKVLSFYSGVYPFYLLKNVSEDYECDEERAPVGSVQGALVVYNLDETIELVTFGRSEETKMFSQDLVKKVEKGMLTNYTISYDNTPRVTYWIGNRQDLFQGGQSTVELDFTGNANLAEIKINNQLQPGLTAVVQVSNKVPGALKEIEKDLMQDEKKGKGGESLQQNKKGKGKESLRHKLEMRLNDGRKFKGYIRNIKENAYTAFMKLPCIIPEKLFDAAEKGTISKLLITASGESDEAITEIVFGIDND